MKNLDKLIDQFIGEEKNTPYKDNHTLGDEVVWTFEDGYNQALQDLKSRKQELIEGIVEYMIENYGRYDNGCGCCADEDLCKALTGEGMFERESRLKIINR